MQISSVQTKIDLETDRWIFFRFSRFRSTSPARARWNSTHLLCVSATRPRIASVPGRVNYPKHRECERVSTSLLAPPRRSRRMFALKLPSQIKAGAAEILHSEKKARGELVEIVDPTAHLPWRQNKGGPVWGSKGAGTEAQQANPAPDSPSSGPGDKQSKPGWKVQQPAIPAIANLDPELKVG